MGHGSTRLVPSNLFLCHSCFGFQVHIIIQDNCSSCSHHICIPAERKEEGKEKGMPPPLDTSLKVHSLRSV